MTKKKEGRRICKCECGGTVRGVEAFGRLWTWCEKCTPVVRSITPADRGFGVKQDWTADDWHEYLSEHLDARANFPNGLNTAALEISDAINALLGRNAKLTEALKQMQGFALTPPLRRLVDDALTEGDGANWDYAKW